MDRDQNGCGVMAETPDRKQRLAAALRENLRRRKQQQRARRQKSNLMPETADNVGLSSGQSLGCAGTPQGDQTVDRTGSDENRTD